MYVGRPSPVQNRGAGLQRLPGRRLCAPPHFAYRDYSSEQKISRTHIPRTGSLLDRMIRPGQDTLQINMFPCLHLEHLKKAARNPVGRFGHPSFQGIHPGHMILDIDFSYGFPFEPFC
jgi:hypothetical protein